jgi:hypothetical protein
MHPTVSVCISAYGAPLFLHQVCTRLCAIDIIEAVYVLDGPYRYCLSLYQDSGFYVEESSSPIKVITRDFSKVRYSFDVFDDEAEKRIRLYNSAQGELVLLLDLDEVPENLSAGNLQKFWDSDYAVAPIEMLNIINSELSEKARPKKYALFKRNHINATQHLDYTWLIGVDQNRPNSEVMMPDPVCTVDHYFLLRNRSSLLQKCLFYNSLWYYSNKNRRVFSCLNELAATFGFANSDNKDLILDSLLATSPDYNGFRPATSQVESLPAAVQSRILRELQASSIEPFFTRRSLLPNQAVSRVNFHIPFNGDQGREFLFCKVRIESTQDVKLKFSLYSRDLRYRKKARKDEKYRMIPLLGRQSNRLIPASEKFAWTVYLPLSPEVRACLHEAVLSIEIHQNQEQLGQVGQTIELTEVSFSSERLRLAGFGNCQIESILECIRCSNTYSRYFHIEPLVGRLVHLMSDDQMIRNRELLQGSDVVILQPVKQGYRDTRYIHSGFVTEQCRESSTSTIMIPSLFYSAQNPFTQTITIDDTFLDKPSPLQDLYLVYLAMSYPPNIAASLYNKAIDSPCFISQAVVDLFHQQGIEGLKQREREAIEHFGDSLHAFINYSEYILSNYRHNILHYSDAHPMEAGIQFMAAEILEAIGFGILEPSEEFSQYQFKERGMFPLYASLATAANQKAPKPLSCFLHNHAIERQDMIDLYSSCIYSNYRELLPIFVRSYGTRIIIANHKMGTSFLESMRTDLSTLAPTEHICYPDLSMPSMQNKTTSDYDFNTIRWALLNRCQDFIDLYNLYPHIRYRILQIVQNPIDIVYSDIHHHLNTMEERFHKKVFCKDQSAPAGFRQLSSGLADHADATHTYQEALKSLNTIKRIQFEIHFHAVINGTIDAVGNFISQFESDPNIRLQPVETLPKSVSEIASFMAFTDQEKHLFHSGLASSFRGSNDLMSEDASNACTKYEQAMRHLIRIELKRVYPNNHLLRFYGLV